MNISTSPHDEQTQQKQTGRQEGGRGSQQRMHMQGGGKLNTFAFSFLFFFSFFLFFVAVYSLLFLDKSRLELIPRQPMNRACCHPT